MMMQQKKKSRKKPIVCCRFELSWAGLMVAKLASRRFPVRTPVNVKKFHFIIEYQKYILYTYLWDNNSRISKVVESVCTNVCD